MQGVFPPLPDKDSGPWCIRCNKEYTKVCNIDGQDITLCPRCDGTPEDYRKEAPVDMTKKLSDEGTITEVAASTEPNLDSEVKVEVHDEADEQREEEF
jgi:hypothetical protein